jgi:hypothetical protein
MHTVELSAVRSAITGTDGRRALHSYAGCASLVFKTLCEQAGDADAYDENLTKAEASKRIDELKKELGLES